MRKVKYILISFFTLYFLFGCQEEEMELGIINVPSNMQVAVEIVGQDVTDPELEYGDGTGVVNFVVTADDAVTYKLNFGDGSDTVTTTEEVFSHLYTTTGVNTYPVIVTAIGTGGLISVTSVDVEVLAAYDDPEVRDFLAGIVDIENEAIESSKTWYWAANVPGNIGLGPNTFDESGEGFHTYPAWFFSNAFHPDKLCMYDAEMVFTQDLNGNVTLQQTKGDAYLSGDIAKSLGVAENTCHKEDIVPSLGNVFNVSFFPSASVATDNAQNPTYRGTSIKLSGDGFMSWYVNNGNLEIITISETELYVRIEDGVNPEHAWYCRFQTQDPNNIPEALVWSEEFDVPGAPNPENWVYEFGNNNGWGNQEVQDYTSDPENVIVEDGALKITAKADGNGGYTSARIKTKDLHEFTYGRYEIRAKLPESQGTWPAIWMLGANFDDVGWPRCGEIDIMEQNGWNKNEVFGTIHWFDGDIAAPGFASYSQTLDVENTSTEWKVYELRWSESFIEILVDDVSFYTINTSTLNSTFNKDFFFILNVAMGGTLGGTIDPAFTESTMEIDYIRVYQ